VHRRLAAGDLAAESVPATSGQGRLVNPMVEFTTKFEEVDRFVDRDEAQTVAGVSAADLEDIARLTRLVDQVLTAHAARCGLDLLDGKAEYGFDADRNLMLVDHAGTPDENRFYRDGLPACKELLRMLHPQLRQVVRQAVRDGLPRDRWPRPRPLPAEVVTALSDVYGALATLWSTESPSAAARLSAALQRFLEVSPVGPEAVWGMGA